MIREITLSIIIFFLTPSLVSATTYYVDYENGLDSNDGISTSAPFKHCPGDDNATDTAETTTLIGGDNVIFKGGVQYEGKIDIDWSGSDDSNRIFYDGDSGTYAPRWASGSDKAIIDGNGTKIAAFHFPFSQSYITINSFELRNGKEVPYWNQGGRLINNYAKASTYITVSNSIIHDAGNPVETADRSGIGVMNHGGSHWKIHDNLIFNCYGQSISIKDSSYNQVYNNIITGYNAWGVAFQNALSTPMTDNEFYNNTMYDLNRYASLLGAHGNWLWIYSTSDGPINNMKVYNNLFYNSFEKPADYTNKDSGFIHQQVGLGGSPSGGASWDGMYIYNNVMFNLHSAGAGIGLGPYGNPANPGAMHNIYVYGNTYYSDNGIPFSLINGDGIAANMAGVYIKNNNFMQTRDVVMKIPEADDMSGTVEIDYNNYYSGRSSSYKFVTHNGDTDANLYRTWSDWQTLGYDIHGKGPTSDSLFVDTTLGSNFNLSVQPESPVIDSGTSLGQPYNIDKVGVSRPQGAGWDIGAYEYISPNCVDFIQLNSTHIEACNCSQESVQTAIDAANDGDTVLVPEGECSWTFGTRRVTIGGMYGYPSIVINKSIFLKGSGSEFTIISSNEDNDMVVIDLPSDLPVRITGFNYSYSTNNLGGHAIILNGKKDGSFPYSRIQIDHNTFEKGTRSIFSIGWIESAINNNTFINCNIAIGILGDNNHSWNRPLNAGTTNSLFIESNNFIHNNDADREPNQPIYHQEGGRTVSRYNLFDGSTYTDGNSVFFDSHGNWGTPLTAYRGQPIIEVYHNEFIAHHTYNFMNARGGSVLYHNNNFTTLVGSAPNIVFMEEESWDTGGPWCPSCPVDSAWPAQDQIFNSFLWNNYFNGVLATDIDLKYQTLDGEFIQIDRDYYMHEPDSTGGMESFTSDPGGSMTFNPSGPNAYYPYTQYIYPHPLTIAPFGSVICNEGEITSQCWCQGLRTSGYCCHGLHETQDCTTPSDYHPADIDQNSCISDPELSNFITVWKLGNATMPQLIDAISIWKGGCS